MDIKLPYNEFVFNQAPNLSTGKSPFEIFYELNKVTSIELVAIRSKEDTSPKVEVGVWSIEELHDAVKTRIEK